MNTNIEQEAYIKERCIRYVNSTGAERDKAGADIYTFCRNKYYYMVNIYSADRDDVFQETMTQMLKSTIASYVRKSRSNTFESFFMLTARSAAFKLSNQAVDKNTASFYSQIKEISEKYCIPIDICNAHKFSRILGKSDLSTNKIISAIEGYAVEVPISDITKGLFY